MRYQKQLDKLGVTPGKLALVGLLALVLVMVIVKQLPKVTTINNSAVPTVASQQRAAVEGAYPKNVGGNVEGEQVVPAWPKMDLSETLAINPFAHPSWFEQEETAANDTDIEPGKLTELQEQGTSIVVIAEEQKSARIGDQKYRVGDILEGYQVTDITTRGIVLNKLDPR